MSARMLDYIIDANYIDAFSSSELARDSMYCGVKIGCDFNRIIQFSKVIGDEVCFKYTGAGCGGAGVRGCGGAGVRGWGWGGSTCAAEGVRQDCGRLAPGPHWRRQQLASACEHSVWGFGVCTTHIITSTQ